MKRVLMTGASSGIGRAAALELAKRGCDVVVTGRNVEALTAVWTACGGGAVVAGELTKDEDRARIVEKAFAGLEGVEPILVNAAGIAEFGEFLSLSSESLEAQIAVNLLAPMHLCQLALPYMVKEGSGHIVNVLSIVAELPLAGASAYAASKAALRMFGKVIATEYRRQGVRVTGILPGAVNTPIWDGIGSNGPNRADMLTPEAVATAIADVIMSPPDRSFDEITMMPPKGFL